MSTTDIDRYLPKIPQTLPEVHIKPHFCLCTIQGFMILENTEIATRNICDTIYYNVKQFNEK